MQPWQGGLQGDQEMLGVWGNLLGKIQQWITQQNQGQPAEDIAVQILSPKWLFILHWYYF